MSWFMMSDCSYYKRMKASTYDIQLRKIVSGGHRNIHSYYMILKNSNHPVKYISKAMRLDEDNSDTLVAEVDIKPHLLEIWNYDKMALVERFDWDFKSQPLFTCAIYQDNLELTIKRQNQWQNQIKSKQAQTLNQSQKINQISLRRSKDYPSKQFSAKSIQYTHQKIQKSVPKRVSKREQKGQVSVSAKPEEVDSVVVVSLQKNIVLEEGTGGSGWKVANDGCQQRRGNGL